MHQDPPAEVVAQARALGYSGELLSAARFRQVAGLGRDALNKRVARARASGRGVVFLEDPRRRSSGETVALWFPVEQLDEVAVQGRGPAVVGRVEHELELELERQRGINAALTGRVKALEQDRAALRAALAELGAALVRATGD